MSADKDLLQYSVKEFDDPDKMEQDAKKASGIAFFNLVHEKPPEKFDFDYLKSLHQTLFKDVYSFAGVSRDDMGEDHPYRNMIINDPAHPGTFQRFTPGNDMQAHAADIFDGLEKENNLKGLEKEPFADRLAHTIDQVNQLHPF